MIRKTVGQESFVERKSPGKMPTVRQGRVGTDNASSAHPQPEEG